MTTPETEDFGLKLSKVAELHQRVLSASAARLADWKAKALELQDRFVAAEADIQSQFRRLADREREIVVREKNLEAKELELESIESQLLILKTSIAENVNELGLVEKRVAETKETVILVEKSLEEKEREVGVKEARVRELEEREAEVTAEMEAQKRETAASKRELHSQKSVISKNVEQLEGLLVLIREKKMECKMLESHALEMKSMEIRVRQMEVRVRELEEREMKVQASVDECEKELEMKRGELGLVEKSVAECSSSLESSEFRLHSLKDLINEHVVELGLMESRVAESRERMILADKCLEEKEKGLTQLREEIVSIENSKEIRVREMEEREVKVKRLVDECEKELEMKRGKLCLVENSVAKCSTSLKTINREMGLRGKEICLLKKSMEEWCSKLEGKERELEGVFERFEMRGKNLEPNVEELLSIEKRVGECLKDLELREKSLASVSDELKMKERRLEQQAKELQVKQMELEREKHAVSLEKLKESADAHLNWQLEEEGGEVRLLLKLSGTQHLEREDPLCFLNDSIQEREEQFNALKKSAEEQRKYWESFSQRIQIKERQCELKLKHCDSQASIELLEYTPTANDMIIPSSASDKPIMIMDARSSLQFSMNEQLESVEQAEAVLTNEIVKLLGLFGGDPQVSALLSRDEIAKLINIVSQHKKTQKLCQTHGVEKKIIDTIEYLIGKKKLIEAVIFICTFELGDKFPPVPLLKELVNDAKKCCNEIFTAEKSNDKKEKVVDGRIADLRAAIKCIEDYSLESQYPSIDIEVEIQTLAKLKKNQKLVLVHPSNAEIHEQKKGRKRRPYTSAVRSNYKLRKRMSSVSPSSC